jgi:phosphohistidine phosphatase SixA
VSQFVIVRHSLAVDKAGWAAPDDERPLTDRGRDRALRLVDETSVLPIRRVLASPARRCVETVEPLAEQRGIPIEPTSDLGIGVAPDRVLDLLADDAVNAAVLCTHGEVLTALFGAWQDEGRVALPWSGTRIPKGDAWIIERYPSAAASARHLAVSSTGPREPGN